MEISTIFLTIILLVFGVFQIILFFKIWRMTNHVAKIKKQLDMGSRENIMREIIKGNPNISDILFDGVYNELNDAYHDDYPNIIEKYRAYYKKAGIAMPEVLDQIKCYDDWAKLNSCE